jgi:L-ascorbate metabolism protein UlaG (beta-lactamase superfamily)
MNIKWLGHASFLIQTNGKRILIDPWFQKENQRLVPPITSASAVGKIDLILITHEHFDHFNSGEVESISSRGTSMVVAPRQVLDQINIPQRLKIPVNVGESFNINGIDITVTQAIHPQSSYPVGYIVSDGTKSLYHAGDTYDFYGMSQIACDVALLPIGGTYTLDILSAVTALKKIRAKYAIPMHFDTFAKIKADPKEFAQRVKDNTRVSPILLNPGEAVEV